MARYSFRMQRLFVSDPLLNQSVLLLDKAQSNYLVNVLRMKTGDPVLLFNGRDGEWRARLEKADRKAAVLIAEELTRRQTQHTNLDYLFAPLKQARLDYMVQKAVEMGVSRLRPVLTQHTQVTKVNTARMRANVIEAAEQCGVLAVPEVYEPVSLSKLVHDWQAREQGRRLIFCDEGHEKGHPLEVLRALPKEPYAILIGPEGGFSEQERALLAAKDYVTSLSLGPRILRADTAAVAALTIFQATLGDWG